MAETKPRAWVCEKCEHYIHTDDASYMSGEVDTNAPCAMYQKFPGEKPSPCNGTLTPLYEDRYAEGFRAGMLKAAAILAARAKEAHNIGAGRAECSGPWSHGAAKYHMAGDALESAAQTIEEAAK